MTVITIMLVRRPRVLRCSFCGCTADQVARLLAGPKVHICDVCVATCNKILEATPAGIVGRDATTDDQLLRGLAPCMASVEATRHVLQTRVDALRARGVSWAAIGDALSMSRQAAWERFS